MAKDDQDTDYCDFFDNFETEDTVPMTAEEEKAIEFDLFGSSDAVTKVAEKEKATEIVTFEGLKTECAVVLTSEKEKATQFNLFESSNVAPMVVEEENAININLDTIETEEEMTKLQQIQSEATAMEISSTTHFPTYEEKVAADSRSIYVGNVDYRATECDLRDHFIRCGIINRVSIMRDKFTGLPKGFAFIEYAREHSVDLAMALHESSFKGRQIKINKKRTNRPGLSSTNRGRGVNRWQQRARFTWTRNDPYQHVKKSNKYSKRYTPY